MVLAVFQVLPLSNDTKTVSPVAKLALKVPLMVCAAVWVMKSLALLPVSALKAAVAMVVVGDVLSTMKLPLSATKLWDSTALLFAASLIVPLLSERLLALMLMPLASVWLARMV